MLIAQLDPCSSQQFSGKSNHYCFNYALLMHHHSNS
uniref:Uncharacterized protein n=1 Tax=Arundo donax TaxID=35708 RepID=A0A0A9C5M1_ARUDO